MLADLINASGWTHEQWLTISILVFIVLAIGVMLHRIYKLFRLGSKRTRQPNLRPLRRQRYRARPQDVDAAEEEEGKSS